MQEVATGKYHGHSFGGLNGVPTAYSGLMFANLMTFAHLSVSLAISRPKSAGDPGNTVLPIIDLCPRPAGHDFNFGEPNNAPCAARIGAADRTDQPA